MDDGCAVKLCYPQCTTLCDDIVLDCRQKSVASDRQARATMCATELLPRTVKHLRTSIGGGCDDPDKRACRGWCCPIGLGSATLAVIQHHE